MNHDPHENPHAALRPLASLISKSEKAQQKLKPGSWQHTMLAQNLKALRFATAHLQGEPEAAEALSSAELQEALQAMAAMIARTAGAQAKFAPGSSQHSLQQNRLNALRIAEAVIRQQSQDLK